MKLLPIIVKINLLICTSSDPYTLSRTEALNAWNKAGVLEQQINVKRNRVWVKVRSCNLPTDYKELYSGRQFNRLLRFFPKNSKALNTAIIPGLSDDDKRGIGGVTNGMCGRKDDWNMSIAALTPINASGEDRLLEAPYGIAHEEAHNFGCWHDDSIPNIMNTNPLPLIKSLGSLKFLRACKQEVKECYL